MGLPHRNRRILFSVVADYIATGQAVGSRTVARKYVKDLSAATIRNVLADLVEAGYLYQPHTSAGRVPTERALRAFIEALTEFDEVPPEQHERMRARLEEIYTANDELQHDTLSNTGLLLSELSGAAAVVASSPVDTRTLAQLRFIVTKPDRLLAVMVFSDGMVENRYITVDRPLAENDLLRIHNLLADVVEGRTLASLRDLFARRLDDERVRLDELRGRAFELGSQAVRELPGQSTQIVIEGRSRLLDLPEYADVERLRQLVRALEDRQHLVRLLDETISAGAVSVYIGNEAGEDGELGSAQLSLVLAPYGGERGTGTVGVLGPTRMDYARMVPLVGATAAAMTAAMKKASR